MNETEDVDVNRSTDSIVFHLTSKISCEKIDQDYSANYNCSDYKSSWRFTMAVLSVRLSDAEYKALESYATVKGISLNKAIKDAFFEMLEDQYDLEAFDEAYAAYLKDPKTYSSEELAKELGIK